MLTDDTWLLILLLSLLGAALAYGCLFALINHLIDRATVVHPRKTGATR